MVTNVLGTYTDVIGLAFTGPVCETPLASVGLSGQIDDSPLLVTSTAVDFGTTGCNVTKEARQLTFTNTLGSTQTLEFDLTGVDAAAFTKPANETIGPGSSVEVDVGRIAVSSPTIPGPRQATHTATLQPANVALNIALTHLVSGAFLTTSPESVDFGIVPPNTVSFEDFEIINTGTASTVANVVPQPPFPAPLTLSPTPQAEEVPNGETLEVSLKAEVASEPFIADRQVVMIAGDNNCNMTIPMQVSISCCSP